jgi:hypothetical protein
MRVFPSSRSDDRDRGDNHGSVVPSYGDNPRPACEAVRALGWPPERTGIHGDASSKPDRLVPTRKCRRSASVGCG